MDCFLCLAQKPNCIPLHFCTVALGQKQRGREQSRARQSEAKAAQRNATQNKPAQLACRVERP